MSSLPNPSLYVLSSPSFLALSQTRLTKSGRAAAFPSNYFLTRSIVERSVPMLTNDLRLRTKIRLLPQRGTGTSFSFTSPVL